MNDPITVIVSGSWWATAADFATVFTGIVASFALVASMLEANRRTALEAIDRLLLKWEPLADFTADSAWENLLARYADPDNVPFADGGKELAAYLQALETVANALDRWMLHPHQTKHSLRGLVAPPLVTQDRIYQLRAVIEGNRTPGMRGVSDQSLAKVLKLIQDKHVQLPKRAGP